MSDSEALDILKSAIGGKPAKIKDKSRFRYVMFRAPANTKFLNTVIKLLPAHPEHIDAFVAYFGNFRARRSISRAAIGYLESGLPYSYVRGELWHVIARMGNRDELKRALPLARKDARRRRDCLVLSWGVMHFLIRCQDETLARLGERLASELPLSRALLGPALPARAFPASGLAKVMLKGSLEEQLAAARELQHRNVSLNELGLRPRDVPPICQNSLRSLGVIRRRQRQQDDWINQRLISLYGCTDMPIWRTLLGSEYEHALQILIEGEVLFAGARSEWLALQDSFNDITIRQFFGFLAANSMPGHSKLTGGGKLVKYGNLIAVNSPFDKHYSNEAKLLRNIHVRRNQIPGSHPYDEKGGAQNRWLKKKERDSLAKDAKVVLNLIAAAVKRIAK
ncbi:MAG TPA: hypothetical protein PLP17_11675 [Oligoflexia bacterium]|nr:hypothetical protein [Oligoflexia bacterium]